MIKGSAREEAVQSRPAPAECVVTILAAGGEAGSVVVDGRSRVVIPFVTREALGGSSRKCTAPVVDVAAFTRYLEV